MLIFFFILSAFTNWCFSMKKRLTSPHPFLFSKITIDLVLKKKISMLQSIAVNIKSTNNTHIKYSNCHNLVNGIRV